MILHFMLCVVGIFIFGSGGSGGSTSSSDNVERHEHDENGSLVERNGAVVGEVAFAKFAVQKRGAGGGGEREGGEGGLE
jgi:hypothetical protein